MTPAQYRRDLDRIVRGLLLTLLPILRLFIRSGLADPDTRRRRIDRFAPIITAQLRASRQLVASLTRRFLEGQAKAQVGVSDPYIPALAGYSEQAVRTVLDRIADNYVVESKPRSVVIDNAGSTFVRHAEEAGRQMIVDAVEPEPEVVDATVEETARENVDVETPPILEVVPDPEPEPREVASDTSRPVAWARVLTGAEDCAFCVMLASRGAVYKSKATAERTEDNPFVKYHENCDCVAVPVYTSKAWPGKDEAETLYKLWLSATDGFKQRDAINALRRELYRKKQAGEQLYPGRVPLREAA